MKNKYSITIRGRWHEWAFPIWAEHKHVEEWRRDGLIIDEILHEIPQWAANMGLSGLWIWLHEEMR